MRTLTYFIATSLDGYIAAPDGSIDAWPVEGEHVNVIAEDFPETLPSHVRAALGADGAPNKTFDTVLMGRNTYEPALAAGIARPYDHLLEYVCSTTLKSNDDVTVTTEPLATVRDLKREDGLGIWLAGGAKLAAAVRSEIDEIVLKVYPMTLGSGIPLFDGGYEPHHFRWVSSRFSDNGVGFVRYARATGDVA